MNLEFAHTGDLYIADFTANADFNLHIEQETKGFVDVYQSGISDGKYDMVKALSHTYNEVVDVDCTALIYPKYIRVVLRNEPNKAVVTFAE